METIYYMAPLEGITTYWYRQVYQEIFHDVQKYYTPFLVPHTKKDFDTREKKEILPENNKGMKVVPQILTNQAEDFIRLARRLQEYGYEEVNLNVGCPSGTVTAKGKGAGFLAYPEQLQVFLERIFSQLQDMKISIKTRLGVEYAEEFEKLLEIYNQYPVYELIIHARVLKDYYKNAVDLDAFSYAYEHSKNPLVYNGDIFQVSDAEKIKQRFPGVKAMMLGRGLIANPGLIHMITTKETLSTDYIKSFHDKLYQGYQEQQSGDKNVLYKMKEVWAYMGCLFENYDKYGKQICKCNKCYAYEVIVKQLFQNERIRDDAGFFWK